MSRKPLSKARKAALTRALLDDRSDERHPLTLNPSEKGAPRLTPAEHRRLIGQGLRKRRNDVMYALMTLAKSPVGESR